MYPSYSGFEQVINENNAHCDIFRGYLPADYATNLLNYLLTTVEWEQHSHYAGTENRNTYRMGDPSVKHGYTGQEELVKPWIPILEEFRTSFNERFKTQINSALLNRYRNGHDYIGMHSDRECRPPLNMVVAISLGQTRDFHFKRKLDGKLIKTVFNNGDLMIMYGRCQELFKHGVPARKGQKDANMGERISITFREL